MPVAGDEANGIRTACSRPRSSTHVAGSDHCCFMYGPVGPSANAGCCSPQWPWYDSHANGPSVGGSSPSGSTISSGSMTSTGPVVSSQPKPVAALLPNHSPDSKYEACEPSAEKTIGCVPSDEEDLVAVARGWRTASPRAGRRRTSSAGVCSACSTDAAGNIDLRHLPVALVDVVPLVEDPVQPVLGDHEVALLDARGRRSPARRRARGTTSRTCSPGRGRCRAGRSSGPRGPPARSAAVGATFSTSPDSSRSTTSGRPKMVSTGTGR